MICTVRSLHRVLKCRHFIDCLNINIYTIYVCLVGDISPSNSAIYYKNESVQLFTFSLYFIYNFWQNNHTALGSSATLLSENITRMVGNITYFTFVRLSYCFFFLSTSSAKLPVTVLNLMRSRTSNYVRWHNLRIFSFLSFLFLKYTSLVFIIYYKLHSTPLAINLPGTTITFLLRNNTSLHLRNDVWRSFFKNNIGYSCCRTLAFITRYTLYLLTLYVTIEFSVINKWNENKSGGENPLLCIFLYIGKWCLFDAKINYLPLLFICVRVQADCTNDWSSLHVNVNPSRVLRIFLLVRPLHRRGPSRGRIQGKKKNRNDATYSFTRG